MGCAILNAAARALESGTKEERAMAAAALKADSWRRWCSGSARPDVTRLARVRFPRVALRSRARKMRRRE